jgi:hypothetical protein
VAGTLDILGLANPTADVTVELDSGTPQTANRRGEYLHLLLVIANSAAQYPQVTLKSLFGATPTVGPGRVLVPNTPEVPGYDLGENLTADGRWSRYLWDAENRLVEMRQDATDLPLTEQPFIT